MRNLIILLLIFILSQTNSLFSQSQNYTSGSHTFTVPDGVTTITAMVWGAGGGGSKASLNQKGTGGGGGGFASGIIAVTPGSTISVNVGTGGPGATVSGNNGMAGGNSSINYGAATLTANGGGFGTTSRTTTMSCTDYISGLGGIGGDASNMGFSSFVKYCGGSGADLLGGCAPTYSTPGGAGGGSGSSASNGRNAGGAIRNCAVFTGGSGPNGGVAIGNGGAGGNGGVTNGNGSNGGFPGGGGGGNAGTGNGGNGANGQVSLLWTCSNTLTMGSNVQVICSGEAINDITYSIVGATGVNVTGMPMGLNATYNSGTLTISGTPAQTGNFNYIVTPTGSCTSSITIGSINISGYVKRGGICYNTINDALSMGTGSTIDVLSNTFVESFVVPTGITLIIHNGTTVTNNGTIANNGTIQLNAGGVFTNNGVYKGNGNFNGDLNNTGSVSPGN